MLFRSLGAPVARWWTGVAQGQAVAVASAALAGALLAATLAAPYIFWKPPVAAVAMAGAASTAAVRACLTIYFICLGLWALYLLNFWAFALLIVVFQYYRYRASGD